MVNALKKMDKKFLIFAGLIILFPVLLIVLLAVIRGCGNTKISYDAYEKKMLAAAEKYLNDENKIPEEEGESIKVELSTLVEKEYIKSTEKLLDDSTCEGTVYVRRNGSTVDINEGGFLNYTFDFNCKDYETIHLVDKIKENLVTEEAGLYKEENGYLFKGNKVNNHITYYGQTYRILSIDNDGILKLVKTEPEATNRIWDNKFNTETNSISGKNIYKDSVILDFLMNDYTNSKKFSSKARSGVVAYDVCVGKRSINDNSIVSESDCSEILEKQLISLLNISDYAKASLDIDCTSLTSRACNNYNYLYGVASTTWTLNGVTENSYNVLFLADGTKEVLEANKYAEYNIVIYIDGNQMYKKGNGSVNNPYVIE